MTESHTAPVPMPAIVAANSASPLSGRRIRQTTAIVSNPAAIAARMTVCCSSPSPRCAASRAASAGRPKIKESSAAIGVRIRNPPATAATTGCAAARPPRVASTVHPAADVTKTAAKRATATRSPRGTAAPAWSRSGPDGSVLATRGRIVVRKDQANGGPLALLALDLERTAMDFDEFLRQRQPQARALAAFRQGLLDLAESRKGDIDFFSTHADAVVLDLDHGRVDRRVRPDRDLRPFGAELHRVADRIGEALLHASTIRMHRRKRGRDARAQGDTGAR